MINQLHSLNEDEKKTILDAPLLVAILIAGADKNIDSAEKERTMKLIHTKTFSEHHEIADNIYKALDQNAEERWNNVALGLSANPKFRTPEIQDRLKELNDILPKLNFGFALEYYESLKDFAVYVANASGGIFGIGSISDKEKVFIHLDMINKPSE